jgi:hypothetical protein
MRRVYNTLGGGAAAAYNIGTFNVPDLLNETFSVPDLLETDSVPD